jgi:exodeoxyribonuclease VII small subunit
VADEERFETLFAALEERARKLDEGGLSLEESVKTYEEGAGIAAKLRAMLEQTELRIRELDARFGEPAWELNEAEIEYDTKNFDDE